MKKQLLLLVVMLLPMVAMADAVEIDGIYYYLIDKIKNAEVTINPNRYIGNIDIPESITYDGISYSVTSIGSLAFTDCSGLTSVTIPNSVTSIGDYAFYECTGLTSASIGNGVQTIGMSAFSFCTGLTSVSFPNSVKSIDDFAFRYCTGLTYILIPNGVTSIGGNTFADCTGLSSVSIGESVTSIGVGVFVDCMNLASIYVEPGNIMYDSRGDCNAIIETETNTLIAGCKNTIIPNTVTSIGDAAFSGCIGLTSIFIPNCVSSIGYLAFADCTSLTTVTIPNSVNKIVQRAFSGCSNLESVIIGNSVDSIGRTPFYKCDNLIDIYCYAEKVPITNTSFTSEITKRVTLHVPASSIENYRTTGNWSGFGNIVALTANDPKPTGIDKMVASDINKNEVYFDLNGKPIQLPRKGLNIVRMSDGNVKKVIKK